MLESLNNFKTPDFSFRMTPKLFSFTVDICSWACSYFHVTCGRKWKWWWCFAFAERLHHFFFLLLASKLQLQPPVINLFLGLRIQIQHNLRVPVLCQNPFSQGTFPIWIIHCYSSVLWSSARILGIRVLEGNLAERARPGTWRGTSLKTDKRPIETEGS